MPNPYRKLRAHSPVTAFSITAWNRLMDMLDWWITNQSHSGGGPIKNIADWNQGVFRVKNNSGYDLWSYDPVGLDGPIFDPSDGGEPELKSQTSQKGVEPTVADHAGCKWGVMLEAAANGKIGRCCMAGVVPVRLYVNSATDQYCDVIAKETVSSEDCYLGTGSSGAQILWRENEGSGAGTIVWAIVRLGGKTGPKFYNDSSEAAPVCAVMAVTGVHTLDSGEVIKKIDKPSAAFCKEFIVNGSAEVASKAIGTYQEGPEVIVAYDTGTPAFNDNYGPKAGQWTATAARQSGSDDYYQLFTIHGVKDSTAKTALATLKQIGPPWHPYVNASNPNTTIPAYGVFAVTSPSGFSPDYKVAIAGANHTTLLYSSQFRINGPNAVAYHGFGWCQMATDDYITALFAIGLGLTPDFNWLAGTSCGPLPGQNDYKLWPHLPGFKFLTATGTNGLGHVLRDDKDIYWAKATADWTSYSTDCGYVAANPCNSIGSVVYNGAGNYPPCEIKIALPVRGNSKTPAVFSGDIIPYRIWNGATPLGSAVATPFVAYGDFVDDKIGTVKMWLGTVANIPKGWRVYTAMLERFPVGVYENSDWVPTVGTTGGALTHSHGTDTGTGAGTSAEASLASANHLPPFCGVIFIERYK